MEQQSLLDWRHYAVSTEGIPSVTSLMRRLLTVPKVETDRR